MCDHSLEMLSRLSLPMSPAIPQLLKLMGSSEETIRWRTAEVLGISGIESKPVVRALAEALFDLGDQKSVRASAAAALAKMKTPPVDALSELIRTLKTYDDEERTQGYSSQVETRRWAAKAVGNIGEDARAAVPLLIHLLGDKSVYVRVFAAEALGKMGAHAREAIAPLKKYQALTFDKIQHEDQGETWRAFQTAIEMIEAAD